MELGFSSIVFFTRHNIPEPVDESLSQEEVEIQKRRRGRPSKKKYVSATGFVFGFQRTVSGGSQEQRISK